MATNDASKVEILVMYKECMRNHAAPSKGFLLDGCGLFEARTQSGSRDAMLCAACNCHRNFHRRVEVDIPPRYRSDRRHHHHAAAAAPHQRHGSGTMVIHRDPASAPPQAAAPTSPAPTSPSTSSAAADRGPREAPAQQTRKRRITKEQSEMVRVLSERNDWKMFREYSPEEVARICSEIGITRITLKSCIFTHRRRRAAAMSLDAPNE